MDKEQIEQLRNFSRKLVRELGMLQLDQQDPSITPAHWHSLLEIDREPGITMSQLGKILLMSPSRVSRLTSKLRHDGLIELKPGIDKREKYLQISKVGTDVVNHIDVFSEDKIKGAFQFLNQSEMIEITQAIEKYSAALEKNRLSTSEVKIVTLSTSRTIRKQIINMISAIQKDEFAIPINDSTNICVLKAEQNYCYNNSCNFWYAVDGDGVIIGSIGLQKIDKGRGQIKKFFVAEHYRGKGIAQKLMTVLTNAAIKHEFKTLFLGTVDKLKAAQKFYGKSGFVRIKRSELPHGFDLCELDSFFFSKQC